jgi:flagellar hook-associated protein 3 FlgL
MRITNSMMSDNAVRYMDENLERMYGLQEKIASGKQYQRPSDNPSAFSSILSLRSSLETSQGYIDTADVTGGWMSATDFSLGQMVDIAKRATTLLQDGVNDTQGESERQALATEMDALLKQAIDIGNTTHQGNYIFAGYKVTTKPFTAVNSDPADPNSPAVSVSYDGDNGVILRNIGPNQTITQNINGNTAFSQLFSDIIAARDALNSNDSATIQNALVNLQAAFTNLQESVTTNGARQRQVNLMSDRLNDAQSELKGLLSQKEDVNMTEAISALRNQETVYQAVLEVGNRAISALNLFQMMG